MGAINSLRAFAVIAAAALLSACATLGPPMPMPHQAHAPLLGGLSIVETPSDKPGDTFVVFYSGDGGWAKIDTGTAHALADQGYPVVGIDSLHYFWREKTAQGGADDLHRIIAAYSAAWGRQRVILAGFSFGAATLPSIAADLAPGDAARVRAIILMAPRRYVELVVRPNSWLDIPGAHTFPFQPTLEPMKRWPVLCLAGAKDKIAACKTLPPDLAHSVILPGGHRFDGDYPHIAGLILNAAGSPVGAPPPKP